MTADLIHLYALLHGPAAFEGLAPDLLDDDE